MKAGNQTEQLVPRINANDDHVEIAHLYFQDGDLVQEGQDIADLGTSKATVSIQSEKTGYVKWWAQQGEKASVGSRLVSFFADLAELKSASSPAAKSAGDSALAQGVQGQVSPHAGVSSPVAPPKGQFTFVKFSKAAQEYITKEKIDPAWFTGHGLVTADYIKAVLAPPQPTHAQAPGAPNRVEVQAAPAAKPSWQEPPPETKSLRKVKLTRPKQLEIQSLTVGALGNINSSLTVHFEAEPIVKTLKQYQCFNGSVLPILLYELAHLLEKYPSFNGFFDNGHLVHYEQFNVGLAMDVGKGLKVVTIENTNKLVPAQIFEAITEFALRDMRDELGAKDVTGSTFTVSDLTAQNILHFQPLINGFQAGILGVGGDSTMPGNPMSLTLTFDHRIITGREAAVFLNTLKKNLMQFHFDKMKV